MSLKSKIARVSIFFALAFYVFGWMNLCYCPGEFIAASLISVVPIFIGTKGMRVIGILILGASIVSASQMVLKNQEMKAKVDQIHRKMELQQKETARKPLATICQERIVQAA